jgi:uncharacterized protein YciU (UPF0263 family)
MDLFEQSVHEALDNAKDNGYSVFLAGTAYEVACDMTEYDAQFEDHSPMDLVPHVETWQAKQGETT